jgi:hypothetical protein
MTAELRSVMTGLLSLACVEEQAVLAAGASGPGHDSAGPGHRGGSAETRAAVPRWPTTTSSRASRQNGSWLSAPGQVPPAFGEVDHGSVELCQGYSAQSADEVMVGCQASEDLALSCQS